MHPIPFCRHKCDTCKYYSRAPLSEPCESCGIDNIRYDKQTDYISRLRGIVAYFDNMVAMDHDYFLHDYVDASDKLTKLSNEIYLDAIRHFGKEAEENASKDPT